MADVATPSANFLEAKQGPFPVWVWLAIVGAGAYAYNRHKAKQTASTAAATTTPTNAATSTSTGETNVPDYIAQNYITNNIPSPSSPTPVVTPPPTSTPTSPTAPVPPTAPPKTTTPAPPAKTPTPVKTTPAPVKKTAPIEYKVKAGDNLTAIAKKYGTTAAALWTYNTTPGNRPAATIAELKKRGENLLYSGETILIPQ